MRRRVLVIGVAVLALMGPPAAAQGTEPEDLQARIDAAVSRIADARARADESSAAYFDIQSGLDVLTAESAQLAADVEDRRRTIKELEARLREFAVGRYISAGGDDHRSMLGASDINQAVRRDALADFIGEYEVDILAQLRTAQAALSQRAAELDDKRTTETKLAAELADRSPRLETDVARLQREIEALDAVLAAVEPPEERQRLATDARRKAAEEATRRRAELDAKRSRAASTGPVVSNFLCPLPTGASFTDTWGDARSEGREHRGVDMSAPFGTPIIAPVSGTVTFKDNALGGLTFGLTGDDGNFYYGAHMSRYGKQGRVEAGEVIGFVGRSGNTTLSHLHLEIHIGGQGNPVNPYPTAAAAC